MDPVQEGPRKGADADSTAIVRLDACLDRLPPRHRSALCWFLEHAGTDVAWPAPLAGPTADDPTFLATRAKGIYKPSWSEYALSIRQTLDGPYADREPVRREDGTWLYQYFQESKVAEARDDEFTNRGLMACYRDVVPVGVMRQTRKSPNVEYYVQGLALVAGWDAGYFFFEGFSAAATARPRGASTEVELLARRQDAEQGTSDLLSSLDARERIVAAIVRRRGQGRFREVLLKAYAKRCAITACDAEEALEAAHIAPYRGEQSNDPRNGLLLRADLHTLFDLGLVAVCTESWTVLISTCLVGTSYSALTGGAIALPAEMALRPAKELLDAHRAWAGI
jgi:hypothetical protein